MVGCACAVHSLATRASSASAWVQVVFFSSERPTFLGHCLSQHPNSFCIFTACLSWKKNEEKLLNYLFIFFYLFVRLFAYCLSVIPFELSNSKPQESHVTLKSSFINALENSSDSKECERHVKVPSCDWQHGSFTAVHLHVLKICWDPEGFWVPVTKTCVKEQLKYQAGNIAKQNVFHECSYCIYRRIKPL